jgi:hypothetical protein
VNVIIFILKKTGHAQAARRIEELKDVVVARDKTLTEKDAIVKQTFLNVEKLKESWPGDKKVGEIFRELNEAVGMEKLIRSDYIKHLGKTVGLEDEFEKLFGEDEDPETEEDSDAGA